MRPLELSFLIDFIIHAKLRTESEKQTRENAVLNRETGETGEVHSSTQVTGSFRIKVLRYDIVKGEDNKG